MRTKECLHLPLSPLELLLSDGVADGALVLGDGCPAALVPEQSDAQETVDLVVLTPSPDQRRDPRWVGRSVNVAASRLSPDGIAYVIPGTAVELRRALAAAGLQGAGMLLHIPDVARGRYLAPVGTPAERYALSGQLAMSRWKRIVGSSLGARVRAAFGPTGAIHRRDPTIVLARWLFALGDRERPVGSALVANGQAMAGGAVIYRFVDGEPAPDAVAKVSTKASDELRALRRIAPAAGLAGARVPAALASGQLGSMPLVLQSALGGRSGALLVGSKRIAPRELQERIARWLEQWARSSAHARPLSREDVERFVLAPASKLAPHASAGGAYLEYLGALCARAVGERCPFVASHGDLTLANVLVDGSPSLGIVDWEEAAEDSLPFTDFFYAAVDAVAARHRYADRLGAFASCFSPDGEHASFVDSLRRRLAGVLEVDEVVQEICFHACWLHHAANEAGRSADSPPGPFMRIFQTIANRPDRFGVSQQMQ